VYVGADLSRDVTRFFDPGTAAKAFVVTHPGLVDAAKPVVDSLTAAGLETTVLPVDDGEASKSLSVAGELLEALTASKANRRDLVVSFGGGVISDLAGFVASIYHRGMPVVHVPTSLLAQVDAAIGGKTAVNLPQGKNLAGTIHQPLAVICDVSLLRALPPEELNAGMAEVIKCALVADPKLVDVIRTGIARITDRDEDTMVEVVRRAAGVKAAIVSADERDLGAREVLNYGHTFGHALEHVTHLRHGEAVAVGMMAEAHLAAGLGMLPAADVEVHRALLDVVGLPVAASFETGEVLEALEHDKKHRGEVRFVLLDGIGMARRGITATREQMVDALRRVAR
jgi:3-dehydroquinate synthase